MTKLKFLYFVANANPTAKERDEIEKYKPNIQVRNARNFDKDSFEVCDGVGGSVPDAYNDAGIPSIDEALKAAGEKTVKGGEKVGAPNKAVKATKPVASAADKAAGAAWQTKPVAK